MSPDLGSESVPEMQIAKRDKKLQENDVIGSFTNCGKQQKLGRCQVRSV